MNDDQRDAAVWASITSTGDLHTVRCWLGKADLAESQCGREAFATLSHAVAYAHEIAMAHEFQTIYWRPDSHWRPGELEEVR